MIFIGIGAVVTVWVGILLLAIIEGIASCFPNRQQGYSIAWFSTLILVIIITGLNPYIGIFVIVGLFWAFIFSM